MSEKDTVLKTNKFQSSTEESFSESKDEPKGLTPSDESGKQIESCAVGQENIHNGIELTSDLQKTAKETYREIKNCTSDAQNEAVENNNSGGRVEHEDTNKSKETGEGAVKEMAYSTSSAEMQATAKTLSDGLLEYFLPNLEKSQSTLYEVTQNQKVLIETVQQENAKFDECTSSDRLREIFSQVAVYHSKLLGIKKMMAALQEKSAKLKKRALKLQQQKQKEELQRAQQQETEMERERMLAAKVAPRSPDR